MNVGISVSRVGGSAQIKAMKKVAGRLRLDLAQYREMEAFAQFASDLDAATQRQLARGERTVELLNQGQYQPMPVEHQVAAIFAVTNGYLDQIPVNRVKNWEVGFHRYLDEKAADLLSNLVQEKELTDELRAGLVGAIEDYQKEFEAS